MHYDKQKTEDLQKKILSGEALKKDEQAIFNYIALCFMLTLKNQPRI